MPKRFQYIVLEVTPTVEKDTLAYYVNKSITQTLGVTGSMHFEILALQAHPETIHKSLALVRLEKR
jgi:hypothetical protein